MSQPLVRSDLDNVLGAIKQGSISHYETAAKLGWTRQKVSRVIDKFDAVEHVQTTYRRNKAARLGKIPAGEFVQDFVHNPRVIQEPTPEIVGADSHVEPDITRIRESAERRFAAKSQRAEQKRHQKVRFPFGPVALFFVSDQHIGAEGTDVARMFREQEQIVNTPGAYVWQTGDVVDSMIMGRLISENMNPSLPVYEQWQLAKAYLAGFGERLVAHVAGNHDNWHRKLTGVDYARDICPDGPLYDSDEIRATVHVGNQEFAVYSRHKTRGNSIYNPTHGLERIARFDTSRYQIYAAAHVHRGAVAREFTLDGDRKIALMSGTYKTEDSWALEMGFEKHDSSTACAVVLHDDGSFWATSNLQAVMNYQRACYR